MASPGFIRHQAAQFDAMMAPTGNPGSGRLSAYFNEALKANKSWKQIFQDLLLPNENDPKQKGSIEFLKARVSDLDRLTIDVSVLFFGVNVSCAQCHNHPLVQDWKQDHFYGMKSFFIRTVDNGGTIAEKEFGQLKFKPNKGSEKPATPLFLSGDKIELANFREPTSEEQKKDKERLEKNKANKTAPTPPAVSARAKLFEVALKPGNSQFFNKAIVNRLWHRFFGYGLVTPLDQMHSENPPNHPDLLEWLARDMVGHNYDLKRLIRGIVLSEPYARSSQYAGTAPPDPKYFAVARLKAATPMQYAVSLKIATTDPASFEKQKPEALEKKIEQLEGAARGFASLIAMPSDDFQIGVNEALLFSNNGRVVGDFLGEGQGTLIARMMGSPDSKQAIELAVRSIFCRPATNEEIQLFADYLQKRTDRSKEAYRQLVWAMISSAELRFNY